MGFCLRPDGFLIQVFYRIQIRQLEQLVTDKYTFYIFLLLFFLFVIFSNLLAAVLVLIICFNSGIGFSN